LTGKDIYTKVTLSYNTILDIYFPFDIMQEKNMSKAKIGLVGTLALIFVTAFSLSEATSLGEKPEENIVVSEELNQGLQLILSTDKAAYQSKEPIVIVLTLTNEGLRPIKLTFPSAQKYDFIVRKDKEEIWRWSEDKMFALMLTELTLQPNQSLTYEEIWTQEDMEARSIKEDREYAGWIYQNRDGTYSYTSPLKGMAHSSNPGPKPSGAVAYYHSHGAESPDYKDEEFSNYYNPEKKIWVGDIPFAESYSVDGYLVTPSKAKKRYIHSTDKITEVTEPAGKLKEGGYTKYK
jgi:hypothetical protein